MDSYLEDDTYYNTAGGLSYDDTTTYEEQVAQIPVEVRPVVDESTVALALDGSLASRISKNKAYLAPASTAKVKRKREDDEEEEEEENMDVQDAGDGSVRQNALLLKGTPISHLPTGRIFAYAKRFEAEPVALEWIDDTTCVLIFSSNASARSAYSALLKSGTDDHDAEPDEDGMVVAKSLPVTLWPPEDRINKTLGMSEGLKGVLRMRWARKDDVKRKGARKESMFYRKHGMDAGKDPNNLVLGRNPETDRKRRRVEPYEMDDEDKKRMLDAELDAFLAQDDSDTDANANADLENNSLHKRLTSPQPEPKMRSDALVNGARPRSPPSKMRADYIDGRGRSLLERTSLIRAHSDDLELEGNRRIREWDREKERGPRRRGGRRGRDAEERIDRLTRPLPRRAERPKKTQEELDAELEAFLARD